MAGHPSLRRKNAQSLLFKCLRHGLEVEELCILSKVFYSRGLSLHGDGLYLELITPAISRLDTTSISAPTRVRETVEPRLYSKLLVRLLALPIAALSILALILGYGLQRVNESADVVDRAD